MSMRTGKGDDGKEELGDRCIADALEDPKGAMTLMMDSEWPADPELPTEVRTWLAPYEWINL